MVKEALGIEGSVIRVERGFPESLLDCNIRQVWTQRWFVLKCKKQRIKVFRFVGTKQCLNTISNSLFLLFFIRDISKKVDEFVSLASQVCTVCDITQNIICGFDLSEKLRR